MGPSDEGSNKRIALVIGNSAYTNAPTLKNPANDALDMADTLAKLGFKVEHGVNLTQRQMKSMIRVFGQKLKAGGQGLFYFSGHGVQLRGHNYLIPVDADVQSEADVEDLSVDSNLVLGLMDDADNGLNVVILDACRNNPFTRSFRSVSNGLAQVEAPTGTLIAYATAPGRVARDGAGRNGTYTAELLKQMNVPGLPVEELLKRVRANLKQQTAGEQVPWESSSLVGDFYLNKPPDTNSAGKTSTSGTSSAAATAAAVEQEFWDSIKSSTDAEDFRVYQKEYPNGLHSVIARNNLRRLDAANNRGLNVVAAPPTGVPAKELLQRSYNYWRACDYDQAIMLATEVINGNPDSVEAYTTRGAAYLFNLEMDRAVSDLSEAIRLQPRNAVAFRWRAMAYQGLMLEKINNSSFSALKDKDVVAVLGLILNPKDAWEYEARGYAYYQESKYDLAMSDFSAAIRLDPTYLPSYVFRGAANNFKDSSGGFANEVGIKDMSKAIQLNPRFVGGYFYRGLFLQLENEANIEDFSELIRLAPGGTIAYMFRGLGYIKKEQFDLAIKDFSDAIRLGAKRALENRANAYVQIDNFEAALKDYTEYIGYDPTNSSMYADRAKVYRKLGRTTLAEADERKVKELSKK